MKILTVIGARPQFIKAAPLSRLFRSRNIEEYILHTGQHYDPKMSKIFFDDLKIPLPTLNLSIGSASHGKQTGFMLIEIEKVVKNYKPDWVLVYGDTNSTLAGALAASKLNIKVVHVESGLRSFDRKMPEEINRLLTDHVSNLLCCPSEKAVKQLHSEGIKDVVAWTGDIMFDAFLYDLGLAANTPDLYNCSPNFALLTMHRPSNTDDLKNLSQRLTQIEKLNLQVIWPVHPRNTENLGKIGTIPKNITLLEPAGRLEMLNLIKNASLLITDSGGLQKEAYWSKTPCFTLRDSTEWTETVDSGWNILVDLNENSLEKSVNNWKTPSSYNNFYGEGNAASKIVQALTNFEI